jgi:hypothetical protein
MKKYIFGGLIGALILFISSCAPTRYIEPMDPGDQAFGFSLGGPLIESDGIVGPIPLTSISYARGLKENLNGYAGLHTTAMLFTNFQVDLGITYRVLEQNKWIPSISVGPGFNMVVDMDDAKFKLWPFVDVNAYWNFGERNHLVYMGISNWFEIGNKVSYPEVHNHRYIPNPHIGITLKAKKWQYTMECKMIHPAFGTLNTFVAYPSLLDEQGGIGVFVGFTRLLKNE